MFALIAESLQRSQSTLVKSQAATRTLVWVQTDLSFRPVFNFPPLALFAFWLRSSVVSVLFSLISEIFLREKSMIKSIFVLREASSGLAYDASHCVPGLTLPPGDAKSIFHQYLQLV